MRKTTSRADPALGAELDALIAARGDAWHDDYLDAVGWWLLLLLVCAGGLGAAIWYHATEPDSVGDFVSYARAYPVDATRVFVSSPHWIGPIAALVVGAWTVVTWARNHRRRGVALAKDAIVLVRGRRLRVLPLAEVAAATHRQVGKRGKRFTVATITTQDGARRDLYVNGRWAQLLVERVGAR